MGDLFPSTGATFGVNYGLSSSTNPAPTSATNSPTWWQTAIGTVPSVLNSVLTYKLDSKALNTGVIQTTPQGTTVATLTGQQSAGQTPNNFLSNLGASIGGTNSNNIISIVILVAILALGFKLVGSLFHR